jgi:hypothetical protein
MRMSVECIDFLTDRRNLRHTEWRLTPLPPLEEGQVRVKIDSFAFTSNNITYAALGEKVRYWDFFPAPTGFGRFPVWGFADVAESRVEGLAPGERIFGFLPISTDLILTVGDLSVSAFTDASPWRSGLPGAYNQYRRVSGQPAFSREFEATQAIFRPLFRTSFLLEAFLNDNAFFGAGSVLISSASSKTSLGLGYLLASASRKNVRTIGLTSHANAAFVSETGYFDQVVIYEDIGQMEKTPSVFVDMAGDQGVRTAVHERFDNLLKYSSAVGATHWENPGGARGLRGPKPVAFLGFEQIAELYAKWGPDGFEQRVATVLNGFLNSAKAWLQTSEHRGRHSIETFYHDVLAGRVDARSAHMASIQD